jgi:hypothetical protein
MRKPAVIVAVNDPVLQRHAHALLRARGCGGCEALDTSTLLRREVLACSVNYPWPGHVREVKNLVEATRINFINVPSRKVTMRDIAEPFRRQLAEAARSDPSERERVLAALLRTGRNVSRAARQLRWSRMTLYRKSQKYQIVKSSMAPCLAVVSPVPSSRRAPVSPAVVPVRERPLEADPPDIGRLICQEA